MARPTPPNRGRLTVWNASGDSCEVWSADAREYIATGEWFSTPPDSWCVEDVEEAMPYQVIERADTVGWYNVVDPDGHPVNDKALRKADAAAFLQKLAE